MTNKQQKIIDTASELFSKNGFEATSTRLIAIKAGVSEGLIFRHFNNKDGLLNVLLNIGQKKLEKSINNIESLTHPKVILKQIISLPFNVLRNQQEYWNIYYNLRWKKKINPSNYIYRLSEMTKNAFHALDFSDPQSESDTFMMIWEGALVYVLLNDSKNAYIIFDNLLSKYDL